MEDLVLLVDDLAGRGVGHETPLGVCAVGIAAGDREVDAGPRRDRGAVAAREHHGADAGDLGVLESSARLGGESIGIEAAGEQTAGHGEAAEVGDLGGDQNRGESGLVANEDADRGIEDGGAVDVRNVADEHELRVTRHRIGDEGKHVLLAQPGTDGKELLGLDAEESLGVLLNEAPGTVRGVIAMGEGGAVDPLELPHSLGAGDARMVIGERHPAQLGVVDRGRGTGERGTGCLVDRSTSVGHGGRSENGDREHHRGDGEGLDQHLGVLWGGDSASSRFEGDLIVARI